MAEDVLAVFNHAPGEVLDYKMDWTAWLALDNDTLATSAFAVDPTASGLTVTTSSKTTKVATVWLTSSGTLNLYAITNTVTTSLGRTAKRSFLIQVVPR